LSSVNCFPRPAVAGRGFFLVELFVLKKVVNCSTVNVTNVSKTEVRDDSYSEEDQMYRDHVK
jgi:hypothetical protein